MCCIRRKNHVQNAWRKKYKLTLMHKGFWMRSLNRMTNNRYMSWDALFCRAWGIADTILGAVHYELVKNPIENLKK